MKKNISAFIFIFLSLANSADAKTLLFVAHETKGKIAVYDADSEKLIKNIPTDELPFHLSLHPDKRQIAVSHKGVGADYLKIVDGLSSAVKQSPRIIVGRYRRTGEIYLTFAGSGKKLYAVDSNMNYVDIIETGKWSLIKRVMLGMQPRMAMLSSDNNMLVIPNLNSRIIAFLDTIKDRIMRTVKIDGQPSAAAFSKDGRQLLVLDKENSLLLYLDPQSGNIMEKVVVGNEPVNLLFSPDGSAVYVANYASNSLTVVDAKKMEVIANIAVGIQPFGMAMDDRTGRLYVCNYGEASISIVDTKTNRLIRKIPTDATPTNLIIVGQ